jgi:hypothetical protein
MNPASTSDVITRLLRENAELRAAIKQCATCGASPCVNPSFCEVCRQADRRRPRQQPQSEPLPTPQVTVEAIMYSVRTRGIGALKEPANLHRLRDSDAPARAEINQRIEALAKEPAQ